jgi:hypothetical protein
MRDFSKDCFFVLAVTLIIGFCGVFAVYPDDAVYLPSLNETLYLKNEVYVFNLVRAYNVPLNTFSHTIYTGSFSSIQSLTKRTLFEKRHQLYDFSEEDHIAVTGLLFENDRDGVPDFIQVNKKKRSLPVNQDGIASIPFAPGYSILHFGNTKGLKRQQVLFGTEFCLHVPFFTTCPDDGSTAEVKTAISGAVGEIQTELDSYTSTNNLRDNALAQVLNTQKQILQDLLTMISQTLNVIIPTIAEQESINAANLAFGDLVVQSQINYLKRVTNSLLRYSQAMASTDDRQIVAQPAMNLLFSSFLTVTSYLEGEGYIPIVENNTFTWSEYPLPINVVSNTAYPPNSATLWSGERVYQGFYVYTYFQCVTTETENPGQCSTGTISSCQCAITSSAVYSASNLMTINLQLFYGPIPQALVGIYTMALNGNLSNPTINVALPVFPYDGSEPANWVVGRSTGTPTTWYCVQFGPYIGLANFTSTPYMLNGIPAGYTVLNDTTCDSLRLRTSTGNTIYSLYVVKENVIIPFYSNCSAARLVTSNVITSASNIGYLSQYPQGYSFSGNRTSTFVNNVLTAGGAGSLPSPLTDDILTNSDMYQYHMLSASCAINLEPEWIGSEYYFSTPIVNITGIHTGFKLDQFTVNPAGEISSSIEFVYTSQWVPTYVIERVSNNKMITDEIDVLDGSKVLFFLNGSTVIDESNYFFGQGNNGRDCIQQSDSYPYDLTSCIYQNDLVGYDANNYFQGLVQTSGVARYVNKFNFTFSVSADNYSVTLQPQTNADFNFYIEPDGTICPKIVNTETTTTGCTFTFFFTGTNTASFGGVTLSFTSHTATITTDFGLQPLAIGNPPKDCLLVYCKYTNAQSVIQYDPPQYTLISASDLALQTEIYNTFDNMANGSFSNLQNVIDESAALYTQNQALSVKLAQINFSVAEMYKYQNFSVMRQELDAIINAISPEQPNNNFDLGLGDCSSGIFGSISCFFSNLLSTIVTILIIVAVVIGLYIVCFKMGVAKMITKKVLGSK